MYREDTDTQDLERTILKGGSTPSRLDKGAPVVAVLMAVAVAKVGETC
jgi:hypothetical protein